MKTRYLLFLAVALSLSAPAARRTRGADVADADSALRGAKAFVEKSDRYLHHDRVRRGMKGYGLTVLAGTTPVKFGIEVVSVMDAWGPGQSAILITMNGQGLEKTGVISGMSGSPVFVTDPRDNKAKMIGAVAFGWNASKTTLCGVQPITQMLAVHGAMSDKVPVTAGGGERSGAAVATETYLKTMLNPRKVDFSAPPVPPAAKTRSTAQGRLVPLSAPLMVSGLSAKALADLDASLRPMGMALDTRRSKTS